MRLYSFRNRHWLDIVLDLVTFVPGALIATIFIVFIVAHAIDSLAGPDPVHWADIPLGAVMMTVTVAALIYAMFRPYPGGASSASVPGVSVSSMVFRGNGRACWDCPSWRWACSSWSVDSVPG